jgi:hypothetical protein
MPPKFSESLTTLKVLIVEIAGLCVFIYEVVKVTRGELGI